MKEISMNERLLHTILYWTTGVLAFPLLCAPLSAQTGCPRLNPGAIVTNPPELRSVHGVLAVDLSYNTDTDADGRTLFCFSTPDGTESPTLRLHPGDHMIVRVKNNLPAAAPASVMQMSSSATPVCGAAMMDASSVNLHWHGTNISPKCGSDEVLRTLINSGDTFTYHVTIPADEPPGLYWYHPHVHGIVESAVQGGASGALIVEGIENVQPAVAGLPERLLIIRDQLLAGSDDGADNSDADPRAPSWDVTLNYVPIPYPALTPAVIGVHYNEEQFWRVLNASADTILQLKVEYDGVPQTLMLVALDGVPVDSQEGRRLGTLNPVTEIRLPPASRAEFIVTGPPKSVRSAQFVTDAVYTGPAGDNDTRRVLARIAGGDSNMGTGTMPMVSGAPWQPRFNRLASETVTAHRKLYFSENDDTFFITVDGEPPLAFSTDNPPAIETTQGSVEEWIIENRSLENHEFHFHQLHFLVMGQDDFQINGSNPVKSIDGQMMDMIEIP
jgi:FtsP/CotA-like multicopper oxidase with cupredoxin domain